MNSSGFEPQVDAIAALLKQESGLRLAINGHTDDTGSVERFPKRELLSSEPRSLRSELMPIA